MAGDVNSSRPNAWVTLIGLVLTLIGIYGSARTVVNLVAFPKYPTAGVLTFNFMGSGMYYPREEDCMMQVGMDIVPYPGETALALSAEDKSLRKEQEKKQQEICMSGVVVAREQAKVNDMSQSLLFLFLGGGVLVARKYLFV